MNIFLMMSLYKISRTLSAFSKRGGSRSNPSGRGILLLTQLQTSQIAIHSLHNSTNPIVHGSRLSVVERRRKHHFDTADWKLYYGSRDCKPILQFTFKYIQLLQQRGFPVLRTFVEFFCQRFGGMNFLTKQSDSVLMTFRY